MANLKQLHETFIQLYGEGEARVHAFHAPGRVNLIGEHTDYNGGYVFPAALTFGTTLLIRERGDRKIGLASTNFSQRGWFEADRIVYDDKDDWMNYPKGIVRELQQGGEPLPAGYELLYHGEIPNGAGLSSSASIEVVTAYALLTLAGREIDRVQIAQLAQRSENEFNGVQCGIMDQFAVATGRRDHAILLMCDTLEYELVPLRPGRCKLVIGNTNKRRGLVDSKYNERRSECERAVEALRPAFPKLELLGQLTLDEFEAHAHLIADETVRRRARHVVEEIDRVVRSVEALKRDDLETFGQLMNASHDSLRELYEVTGAELDAMVEAARAVPGVLGSRMTGAGFGGCTVSLVHEDSVASFRSEVGRVYREATGLEPEFYVCDIGNGAEQLQLPADKEEI
ncbi:galactokinase [Paenibacillus sp. IB182496]|uniref:Galactokinase n=1 Tax=Paenibacillus sabuli TaxID=2772509 RepID=A0A927GRQ0_9BACL|nr:galactokinase [Paenibacillus sabuli]MBD2844907.1 galactokinase [Paenibacillus sabuli]